MIDVDHHISEVSRSIGSRVLDGGEVRVLTASRVYQTDQTDLWDACTNPERIPRWFMPVSGDLKVGGRYRWGRFRSCSPSGSPCHSGMKKPPAVAEGERRRPGCGLRLSR